MATYFWLAGSLLLVAAAWYLFWLSHARHFKISGYTPPETSGFGKLVFLALSRLVVFLTVGPLKVLGKENAPKSGRVLVVGNHQVPSDFAVARLAFGRYFRGLGAAAQFPGFLAVLAAWLGIIPVTYKSREERAQAEAACVSYLASGCRQMRFRRIMPAVWIALLSMFLISIWLGLSLALLLISLIVCGLGCLPGGDRTLLIAPQGALLPDNELLKAEFRPGAVRVARAAACLACEPVMILPMAVHYKRDPKDAHWTHWFLKKPRSMFLGMRNPVYWDPLFKLNLDELDEAEKTRVEQGRAQALEAYRNSHVVSYGCVVVVGEPIDPASLACDPVDAIEEIRLKIAALLEEAKMA